MVSFSLCPSHPSSSLKLYHSQFTVTTLSTLSGRKRRTSSCRFVVLSTHSNPKILKSNRRSRYGQPLSPYDDQEDDAEAYHFGDVSDDDWLLNVSSSVLSLSLSLSLVVELLLGLVVFSQVIFFLLLIAESWNLVLCKKSLEALVLFLNVTTFASEI